MYVKSLFKIGHLKAIKWLLNNSQNYALVPVMPTKQMITAACGENYKPEDQELLTDEWQAMIDAHNGEMKCLNLNAKA